MLGAGTVGGAFAVYAAMLLVVGWRADRADRNRSSSRMRGILYGLSIASVSSTWTYFRAVGEASKGKWLFLAYALGPIFAITLGYPAWRKIALLTKQENVGSIADFMAARYGKNRRLGMVVAAVATFGALPFIALQLLVLDQVWSVVTGAAWPNPPVALAFVALLCGLAVGFGARRPSLTERLRGFVTLIAIEASVKLLGILAVAGMCVALILELPHGLARAAAAVPPLGAGNGFSFVVLTLLITVTVFTYPRQFYLSFVAIEDTRHLRTGAWVFPLHVALMAVASLVIATTIRIGFIAPGSGPALLFLDMPMRYGGKAITLVALLGGVAAGSAMVIVETTAISVMIANEIIVPLLGRRSRRAFAAGSPGEEILLIRRATIVAIGLLAWIYYVGVLDTEGQTNLGVTALAGSAQLVPALFGGLYWRRGHAAGAIAGILAGAVVWLAAIVAPPFFYHVMPSAPPGPPASGPLSGDIGVQLTILAALAINAGVYVLVSLRARPELIDSVQAEVFVSAGAIRAGLAHRGLHAKAEDLEKLLAQFIGREDAAKAFREIVRSSPATEGGDTGRASPALAREVERVLAGVVGAPSARDLVAIALAADTGDAREITRILDGAAHAVLFSRELLQTTLDALEQGIGVVDAERRLMTWNASYLAFLSIPDAAIHSGKPLREVLTGAYHPRWSAPLRNGLLRWLDEIGERRAFAEERTLADGRVIELRCLPVGASDYLTSITDVTGLKAAERVLARSNEELERRVVERTAELTEANRALAAAKQVAEQATNAQRRFVAAASHDLVQPLHAARLFIGNAMLDADEDSDLATVLDRADQAVAGAHQLLRALLNLSQVEIGVVKPRLEPVDAGKLLQSLAQDFLSQASARGLELVVLRSQSWVLTDRDLLRAMLQNLVLNAIRYTAVGRVVLLTRGSGDMVRFEVRDSGVGIPAEAIPAAFGEFRRLEEGQAMAEGAGLGLAIVARIGQVLGHPVKVRSKPALGSVFSIEVPRAEPLPAIEPAAPGKANLRGLRVLCIDDERDVLIGTKALIERWGGIVTAVGSAEEVPAGQAWDATVADFHLGGETGLELLRRLADRSRLRILLLAAGQDNLVQLQADTRREGILLLHKPVAPLVLQATLMAGALEAKVELVDAVPE